MSSQTRCFISHLPTIPCIMHFSLGSKKKKPPIVKTPLSPRCPCFWNCPHMSYGWIAVPNRPCWSQALRSALRSGKENIWLPCHMESSLILLLTLDVSASLCPSLNVILTRSNLVGWQLFTRTVYMNKCLNQRTQKWKHECSDFLK